MKIEKRRVIPSVHNRGSGKKYDELAVAVADALKEPGDVVEVTDLPQGVRSPAGNVRTLLLRRFHEMNIAPNKNIVLTTREGGKRLFAKLLELEDVPAENGKEEKR